MTVLVGFKKKLSSNLESGILIGSDSMTENQKITYDRVRSGNFTIFIDTDGNATISVYDRVETVKELNLVLAQYDIEIKDTGYYRIYYKNKEINHCTTHAELESKIFKLIETIKQ